MCTTGKLALPFTKFEMLKIVADCSKFGKIRRLGPGKPFKEQMEQFGPILQILNFENKPNDREDVVTVKIVLHKITK